MGVSTKNSSSRSSTRKDRTQSGSSRPVRRREKKGVGSKPRYTRPLTIEELKNIRDEDIDFSDIPEATEEWFKKATIVHPEERKAHLTIRFDPDIVAFFKRGGPGYQTRMNAVLRAYVDAHKEK